MVKIGYCQATYSKDFEESKKCIERLSPWVDIVIISYDQSLSNKQITWFEENKDKYKLELIRYEWQDNMPEMRNSYLDRAKELGIDWCVVSDPDELFSEDLCKNLRELIEKYDSEGFNMIGVPCRDEFINESWLDDLDRVKESPGGKETNFWKPILILKISGDRSDIRYEGVGKEKNVHETVVSSGRTKNINLDKKLYYTHKKNALKIWRNASRNMFISGGGDNVGDENALWTRLRYITSGSGLGVDDWISFEKFVEKGVDQWLREKDKEIKLDSSISDDVNKTNDWKIKIDNLKEFIELFENWLVEALQAGSNPWQTETRECAKWYWALHPEEVDDFILGLIEKVPVVVEGTDTEIAQFVSRTYFEVLGRHPDHAGKDLYVQKIKDGNIKKNDLAGIFRESGEYKDKFRDIERLGNNRSDDTIKDVKLDINNREIVEKYINDCYVDILGRSVDEPGNRGYTENIMSGKMKTSELVGILKNSNEYRQKFGMGGRGGIERIIKPDENVIRPSPFVRSSARQQFGFGIGREGGEILDLDSIDVSKYNTVGLCIIGHKQGIPYMIESISVIGYFVDEIHVQSDYFGEDDIRKLKELSDKIGKEIDIHIVPWKDNFSEYKNKCCGWAKTEWVLVIDHDEIPTSEMANKLRDIILKSDRGNNFDCVIFGVIDEIWDGNESGDYISGNKKLIYQNRNKCGKQLLQWNIPSPFFGDVHIWLKQNYYPWKVIHAGLAYRHVKTKDEILERSVRNIFLGGGGDTVKEKNPNWIELRKVCDGLGIKTYKEFLAYLKKGGIDDKLLLVIKDLRDMKWKDEELQDIFKYYIKIHPEQEGIFKDQRDETKKSEIKILEPENTDIKKLYDITRPAATVEMVLADGIEHDWQKFYKLKEGDIFVEVGPFWGRYGLIAQKLVGKDGKVILIEASPANVATMKNLLNEKLLDKDSVILVPRAIGDKKELVTFYNRGNPASHGLIPPEERGLEVGREDYGKEIKIEADNLDNILDSLGIEKVDLLGCDCEDCEINMLNGLEKWLSLGRIRHVAIATYHREGNHEKAVEILKKYGFKDIVLEDTITYGTLLESWHKNEYQLDDHYIFRKIY